MGRKGSRLTEQRPVPFEAVRHVAYPYDRPRALHRVPFCGLILVETDLDTTKSSSPAGPTTHVLTLASSISQTLPYCFMPTCGQAKPAIARDRSSETGGSSANRKLSFI